MNIKNYWNRTIFKGTSFFAPIKWATSGLVGSAQNWFWLKRYVVKIIRKNLSRKKMIFTSFWGLFSYLTSDPKIFQTPLKRCKTHFFGWESFLTILTTYRFNQNQFWADPTKPEVVHFIGAKKEAPLKSFDFIFLIYSSYTFWVDYMCRASIS